MKENESDQRDTTAVKELTEERNDTCELCEFGKAWVERNPNNPQQVKFNPLFACESKKSNHYGQWMAPFGWCLHFSFSEKKADIINKIKNPSKIVVPDGPVRARLSTKFTK